MPEQQPPPDDQPTSPDLTADLGRPEEQTTPLAQPSPPAATEPAASPPAATAAPAVPKKTYQVTRGVIGGAAAGVLLVGGLAGYAIGATVVANDGPERGRGGIEWRRDFNGPGGGMPDQGPRGNWGGPGDGYAPNGGGQWSGPQDDDQQQPEETTPESGSGT